MNAMQTVEDAVRAAKTAGEWTHWLGWDIWRDWADGWLAGDREDAEAAEAAAIALTGYVIARASDESERIIAAYAALAACLATHHAHIGGLAEAKSMADGCRDLVARLLRAGGHTDD